MGPQYVGLLDDETGETSTGEDGELAEDEEEVDVSESRERTAAAASGTCCARNRMSQSTSSSRMRIVSWSVVRNLRMKS